MCPLLYGGGEKRTTRWGWEGDITVIFINSSTGSVANSHTQAGVNFPRFTFYEAIVNKVFTVILDNSVFIIRQNPLVSRLTGLSPAPGPPISDPGQ